MNGRYIMVYKLHVLFCYIAARKEWSHILQCPSQPVYDALLSGLGLGGGLSCSMQHSIQPPPTMRTLSEGMVW
jgi:hypothetical protein